MQPLARDQLLLFQGNEGERSQKFRWDFLVQDVPPFPVAYSDEEGKGIRKVWYVLMSKIDNIIG